MRRPTELKSQKAASTRQRRRRGSTSPPLVGVETNPGPIRKKARGELPSLPRRLWTTTSPSRTKQKLQQLLDEGLTIEEIMRRTRWTKETVIRWSVRYQDTGKMETRKRPGCPPKRRQGKETDISSARSQRNRPVKRRKQMDDSDHGKVELGLQMGLTERAVGTIVDRAQSTISSCKKRLDRGETLDRKPGSGRPRKTSARDDRHYKFAVTADSTGRTYAPKAAECVEGADGQPVLAPRSVQDRLHEQAMTTKKKVKKPAMTKTQKRARLKWAQEHKDWSLERWRHILWSDESSFTLWPAPHGGKVWVVDSGPGLDPRQLEGTKKHGGGRISVWGCFSASGVGKLKRMKGTMKAKDYHSILTSQVLPELRKRSKDPPALVWLFQQDNASVHTAHECKAYLKKKEAEEGFKVLDWPSQSPDLNPIENLWSILKDQLKKRQTKPTNKEELWVQLQEEWQNLQGDLLKRLVDSMPQRCQDVLAAHGGPTRH